MPESIVFRCLAAIREFLNDDEVPEVAGQGIRLLPGPLLAEAVDAIVDLPETYGPTLAASTASTWTTALISWPRLLPLLERIAGEAVHEQCLDGVRTVQRWWPQVAG